MYDLIRIVPVLACTRISLEKKNASVNVEGYCGPFRPLKTGNCIQNISAAPTCKCTCVRIYTRVHLHVDVG